LKIAEEIGYFDQKQTPNNRNHYNNIYIMLEERIFKDTRFYPRVILGIEKEAKKNNFDTMLNFINEDNFIVPTSIEWGNAYGILVLGSVRMTALLQF